MEYYSRTTQVPNDLFDKWMSRLTPSELKLILVVIRMTRGWVIQGSHHRKIRDWIACSQMMSYTGLSDRAITTATGSLISKGLLVVTDHRGNYLSESYKRRGRTRMFYALAVDLLGKSACSAKRSENFAELDPKYFRTTKPTLTKNPTTHSQNHI